MKFDLPCILFAGGKSSRMGSDKTLLPFGGYSSLAEYQYRRLQAIFKRVFISTKNSSKFSFKADFIIDTSSVFAPTAGFSEIFDTIEDDRFFVLGVDMPFVDKSIIEKLFQADTKDADATVAVTKGKTEALCGIYHRSLEQRFKKMLQENRHKLSKLLDEAKTNKVNFQNDKKFYNLNYLHEYQKAKKIYKIKFQKLLKIKYFNRARRKRKRRAQNR